MDGLYVFNNPWAIQAMEKHTSYCAMMRLGMPIPDTWMVPPKSYEPRSDLDITLQRYARLFDLGEVGAQWVTRPSSSRTTAVAGRASGASMTTTAGRRTTRAGPTIAPATSRRSARPLRPLHRLGPDEADPLRPVRPPARPVHDGRRSRARRPAGRAGGHDADDQLLLRLEFNSCEALRQDGVWHDRLRQRLPRFPGDVAALPLPVARGRQPAGRSSAPRRAGRCRQPRLDAVLRDRGDGRPLREKLAHAAAPERVCRPRSSRLLPPPLPPGRRGVGVLHRRRPRPCARVAALFPAHEVEQFTDLLGPHPTVAGTPSRRWARR